jgi:predicted PurR-regulated permease PerM
MQVKAEVMGSTLGLLKTQFVLVSLTFFVTLLGLTLLGVPYALTISFLAAILDVLPVVGPAIIFLPWAVGLFLTGQYMTGVWIAVLYGSIALLRALAHPYVLGGTLGLHPLAALLSLYLGARLFGPAGLIWGPLILVVLKAAIRSGLLPRPEA